MKTPETSEIVKRALALQLYIDRGWVDVEYHDPEASEKDKKNTAEIHVKLNDWIKQEGLLDFLSPAEKAVYLKPTGALTRDEQADCTWALEKLIPLLWYLGIIPEMPEFSISGEDEHYNKLFFLKKNVLQEIHQTYQLDDPHVLDTRKAQLESLSHAYVLYHWRCREMQLNPKVRVNMNQVIPGIFDETICEALSLLPLDSKTGDIIVQNRRLEIRELGKRELQTLQTLVESRQYAFAWLTGYDEDWDSISTDT